MNTYLHFHYTLLSIAICAPTSERFVSSGIWRRAYWSLVPDISKSLESGMEAV